MTLCFHINAFQVANIPFFFEINAISPHQNAFIRFFLIFSPSISHFFVTFGVGNLALSAGCFSAGSISATLIIAATCIMTKRNPYSTPHISPLRRSAIWMLSAMAAFILYSCASIGNPSGGPRDEDPPRFVKATPAPGATSVSNPTVTIDFNELINVKDAFTKVVVSPPSKQTPRVSANGRRLTILFPDTLLPNTTYTVDFMDAIEDVNEGNKLEGFTYTFSTGSGIDSLRISGMVLDASNLEPQKEVIVGVHSVLADSAFTTLPFERIAKTDSYGRFIIRGLKPGPYRVFALKDMNNDFIWDNPEESIAFYDEIVVPQTETTVVSDTIYNLRTMQIDTIVPRLRTVFLPNDLLLPLFNINFRQQYVLNSARPDSARITVTLNAPSPATPRLSILEGVGYDDWYDLERSATNDTLTFWLREPALIGSDTLRLALDYDKVLRNGSIEQSRDTLTLALPSASQAKKASKVAQVKKKNESDTPEERYLNLTFSSGSQQDIFAPLTFSASEPLESLFADGLHLEMKNDTLWTGAPDFSGVVAADSLKIRDYSLKYPWEEGATYRLRVDSLAATGISKLTNRPTEHQFTIKKLSDYSSVSLRISGLPDSIPAFVELLNGSDSPVRKEKVSGGMVVFRHVTPGTYYARLTLDLNDNGIFDTGNYDRQSQPEAVFYYPGRLNLKQNWDVEQAWSLFDTPVDRQKPPAILKNKPETGKRNSKDSESEEEEEEDGYFDPTVNPFDPKSVQRSKDRRNNTTTY